MKPNWTPPSGKTFHILFILLWVAFPEVWVLTILHLTSVIRITVFLLYIFSCGEKIFLIDFKNIFSKDLFIYFLAVMSLRCCIQVFSSCRECFSLQQFLLLHSTGSGVCRRIVAAHCLSSCSLWGSRRRLSNSGTQV